MFMNEEFEILKQYVKTSKYRYNVLKVLSRTSVKIPTQISKEAHIRKNHISKVLRELQNHNLVECINPDVRKGRLYRLTRLGEQVQESIFIMNERYSIVTNNDAKIIYDNKTQQKYTDLNDIVCLLNNQNETISEYYNILLS